LDFQLLPGSGPEGSVRTPESVVKQVVIRRGSARVEDRPVPVCGDREVLVRTAYSLISAGTETATLRASRPPSAAQVWAGRVRRVGEILHMAATRGIEDTVSAVEARMAGESVATGYSLSGVVLEVGSLVRDLVPGQRVACAGASHAHHAEVVAVPRSLVVPVPASLPLDSAAFVTLGAIALQGVRQADLRLGESAVVVGLGLVGQITVLLLRASGCRTAGIDVSAARVERAVREGLELGLVAGTDDVERAIDHFTAGRGADAALVTAASPSSEPVRQAARLVRRRGRVVVVGDVGMELVRSDLYAKEVEVRVSCSYGPGRYDPSYEEDGNDYPYGFVRWTENRNMDEFLRQAASGAVRVSDLVDRTVPLDRAEDAYRLLASEDTGERPLAVLLEYPEAAASSSASRSVPVVPRTSGKERLGIALVGPGSFATETILPGLASLAPACEVVSVVGRSPNAAREAARRFGAGTATTDLDEALADPAVDLVAICTRHDRHADEAARALLAGKAVFLEKPAAIDLAGLERLEDAWRRSGRPFVVDFNRRFAPDTRDLAALLAGRIGPLFLDYRVNAGKLPREHWVHGREGGGRLVGEACHMIDLLHHLVGSPRVSATFTPLEPPAGRGDLPLGDNFALVCRFADGSMATLTYTSLGHAEAGKERIEALWDGKTAIVEDFAGLRALGARAPGRARSGTDKGHREILRRFVAHARGAGAAPIPPEEIFEVSRFVLELDRDARRGTVEA
jgi:predicted dehydrogenase/threonine dehydrogenase-like Zn-dependent dehydrogenase